MAGGSSHRCHLIKAILLYLLLSSESATEKESVIGLVLQIADRTPKDRSTPPPRPPLPFASTPHPAETSRAHTALPDRARKARAERPPAPPTCAHHRYRPKSTLPNSRRFISNPANGSARRRDAFWGRAGIGCRRRRGRAEGSDGSCSPMSAAVAVEGSSWPPPDSRMAPLRRCWRRCLCRTRAELRGAVRSLLLGTAPGPLRFPSPCIPRPGRRMSGPSVTGSKHHETTEMAEYFVALLLEGAEAFGHQSADQAELHSTTSAGRIAEVAFWEKMF
ncbi:uncharacterized protein [Excalfactoria chinensis]|uniref:uncharacterized protein n=1 Tax=Excalfactoria chinensis TaxID=46218 RepID=UPI003B3A6631